MRRSPASYRVQSDVEVVPVSMLRTTTSTGSGSHFSTIDTLGSTTSTRCDAAMSPSCSNHQGGELIEDLAAVRYQPQHPVEGRQPVGGHQRQAVTQIDHVAHLAPVQRPQPCCQIGGDAREGTSVGGTGGHRAAATNASKSADPRDPGGPEGLCQSTM